MANNNDNQNVQQSAGMPDAGELNEILRVRRDKLSALKEDGRDPYAVTLFDFTHTAQQIKDNFDTLEGQTVCLAGRMMSWRKMGKACFMDLADSTGRMQL